MALITRGRHARRRSRPGIAVLVVGGLVGGAAYGVGAASPDPPPAIPAVAADPQPAAPPIPAATPTLARSAAPLPGAAAAARVDTAWRDFDHGVDLRLALREPPGDHPPLPADSGEGRRIVYSNSQQRVWLVEDDGTVVHSMLVSGRKGVPRPDTYSVFSKSELAWAGHDGITMRWMVRYTWGQTLPLGFHSVPVLPDGTPLQTTEDLGDFRSAGCTRQSMEDAVIVYRFADIGTTVVVTA